MTSKQLQSHETSDRWVRLRRHGLAILTIILLGGVAFFEIRPPSNSFETMCQAACWRMAPLTALIWVAYYHILALPMWLMLVIPTTLAVAVLRPRALLFFIPIVILIVVLRPRRKGPRKPRLRK